MSAVWFPRLEMWALPSPSRVAITRHFLPSRVKVIFFPSTVAKQSSESEVNFLTLKISVWESGLPCADWYLATAATLECTASLQEHNPERAQPQSLHEVAAHLSWMVIHSFPSGCLWQTAAFTIEIRSSLYRVRETVKLPLMHGSGLEGLASLWA